MGKIGTSSLGGISLGPLATPALTGAPIQTVIATPFVPPPEAPEFVAPMPTADDMLAVNDWLTNWQTQLEDIDYNISQQQIDTEYSKTQNAQQAVEDRTAADEAMAARGIFGSSLSAAAAYDIEATRALANTYLDTRLQEAVTAGATRKGTLATAKTQFEAGMAAKYGENAKAVNDELAAGYAEALANYVPPKATTPTGLGTKPAGGAAAKPRKGPALPPNMASGDGKLGGRLGTVLPGKGSVGLGGMKTPKPKKPKKPAKNRR